jgi:sugar (pentulose or hexulose) kinase
MTPKHIAVIDIGKTNAKLALVEAATLQEIAVVTRPNAVRPGPPWPHFDIEGHWGFFLDHLGAFQASHGIDAISVTTHGASGVLLDRAGGLVVPMLDYEHPGPDSLAHRYNRIRPDFAETGSARLPAGLNLGAQFFWLLETHPDLRDRIAHVLTYPQYWGWRLTGEMACDVTSLGCHTDLWDPWHGRFSSLVGTLGLAGKFAEPRRPAEVLGGLLPDLAAATGIPAGTPVSVGIHDSNASLYPYVLARQAPFTVVSTGTWVVSMAVGARSGALDPLRDVLVNVNALGQAVPSARFMGGREYEIIRAGSDAAPTVADRSRVLGDRIMILPAVEPKSGPFAGSEMRWLGRPENDGERIAALSFYLALMTGTCLDLIGARGPVIVEGPFARNDDYLSMLAAIHPDGVEIATSATGTSIGAALLFLPGRDSLRTRPVDPAPDNARLGDYAGRWRAHVAAPAT